MLCLKNWLDKYNLRSTYTLKTAVLWVYMNCGNVWHCSLGNFHVCSFADTSRQAMRTGSFCVTIKGGSLDMLHVWTPSSVNARGGLFSSGRTTYVERFVHFVPNNPNKLLSNKSLWKMILMIRSSEKGRQSISRDNAIGFWLWPFPDTASRYNLFEKWLLPCPYTLVKTKCMTHGRLVTVLTDRSISGRINANTSTVFSGM